MSTVATSNTFAATLMSESALAAEYAQPRWYAAQTCSRHEKRVADQLASRAVQAFLPLYTAQRRWADRKALVDLPLFPSYLFVRIPLRDRLRVLELPGVVRLVSAHGRAVPLPDDEIVALQNGLTAGGKAEPHPFLRVGTRVRVVAGPFSGTTGILLRKKDSLRVVLSLDIIMRSVSVEVDACDVEPLRES